MAQPQTLFDLALINRRRDRWAKSAAAHDFLLQRTCEDLASRLQFINRQFANALILGAHHGVMGRALSRTDNVDWIISADSTERLIGECPAPKIVANQEWMPIKAGSMDLIVSPLTLQFANDLPGTLVQIQRALKKDGLLLAAMLGGETLHELRYAWLQAESEIAGGAAPRVAPFADIRDLGALLQRAGFALPVVDSERLTVTYATPQALMQEIKAMAASNPLADRSSKPVTRRLLTRACEIYQDNYADPATGRIPATIEILTLSAWAPDASQPKPLKPGSAKMRLADALGAQKPDPKR